MTLRALVAICCCALLVGCGIAAEQEGQPSPAPPSADGGAAPTPTAAGAPEPTALGEPEADLLVSEGVRLDRLENNGGRTLATVTNLNSLPVDARVSVTLFPGAGVRTLGLTGRTSLDGGATGTVLLTVEGEEAVDCSGGCNYDFGVEAQVSATDEELSGKEVACTPEVCQLDPAPTPTPTPSG